MVKSVNFPAKTPPGRASALPGTETHGSKNNTENRPLCSFAATPITTLASVAINAGLGVANYAGEQAVKGEEITVKGVVINGIAGGIGGAISGSGLDCTKLTDSWKHAAKVIAKESTRENVKVATKRIAVQIAVKKSVLRQIGTTVVRFFGGVLGADAAKSKSGELFQ